MFSSSFDFVYFQYYPRDLLRKASRNWPFVSSRTLNLNWSQFSMTNMIHGPAMVLHLPVLHFQAWIFGHSKSSCVFSSPVFSGPLNCLLCRTCWMEWTGVWDVFVVESEGCGGHKRHDWEESSQKGGMLELSNFTIYHMLTAQAYQCAEKKL